MRAQRPGGVSRPSRTNALAPRISHCDYLNGFQRNLNGFHFAGTGSKLATAPTRTRSVPARKKDEVVPFPFSFSPSRVLLRVPSVFSRPCARRSEHDRPKSQYSAKDPKRRRSHIQRDAEIRRYRRGRCTAATWRSRFRSRSSSTTTWWTPTVPATEWKIWERYGAYLNGIYLTGRSRGARRLAVDL